MCKDSEQRRPVERSWKHQHFTVNSRKVHQCSEAQSNSIQVNLNFVHLYSCDGCIIMYFYNDFNILASNCSVLFHRFHQHIPFRESKLTHFLQGFFCGRGKACMIININQCASMYDETLNVLKFSAVAQKVIRNLLEL